MLFVIVLYVEYDVDDLCFGNGHDAIVDHRGREHLVDVLACRVDVVALDEIIYRLTSFSRGLLVVCDEDDLRLAEDFALVGVFVDEEDLSVRGDGNLCDLGFLF